MTITNKVTLKSLNAGLTPATDVPDAPTIGTATDAGSSSVSVTFTPAATGGTPTSYTVTSSPGSLTGTGASSPVTVSGLSIGTAYTFTVTATNSAGTSPASSASNSVTPAMTALGYESIATATATGGETSLTFSSIPSTYTHLQIRAVIICASGNTPIVRFNSDSGTNYSRHQIYEDGSSTVGSAGLANTASPVFGFGQVGTVATYPNVVIFDLLDYANTSKYKTFKLLSGSESSTAGSTEIWSGNWRSTSAVSTIAISNLTFLAGSKIALYGIKG